MSCLSSFAFTFCCAIFASKNWKQTKQWRCNLHLLVWLCRINYKQNLYLSFSFLLRISHWCLRLFRRFVCQFASCLLLPERITVIHRHFILAQRRKRWVFKRQSAKLPMANSRTGCRTRLITNRIGFSCEWAKKATSQNQVNTKIGNYRRKNDHTTSMDCDSMKRGNIFCSFLR